MSCSRFKALRLFINGKWLGTASDGRMPVVNPATGAPLGELPMAGEFELELTLDAAQHGFRLWRDTAPAERCAIILRAAQLIREREESIALVMTEEQGKPLRESRLEVIRAAELIEWAAEEGRRTYGLTIPAPPGHRYLTFAEPLGAVAALTPWNFPAVSPARKIGSALAAGCSCVLKPSELTPGTAMEMVKAFDDAGLPAGVLNLVFGDPERILVPPHSLARHPKDYLYRVDPGRKASGRNGRALHEAWSNGAWRPRADDHLPGHRHPEDRERQRDDKV